MEYKVVLTPDAESDLEGFIRYLLFEKRSEQAASNVLNDFELTKNNLSRVAGSLKLCDNPQLKELGYESAYCYGTVLRCTVQDLISKLPVYHM